MLGGMNTSTSRYIVSSTMAHLLICQGGTRFQFSHGFTDLLVGQLEAALEGKPVDFRLRMNRHRKKELFGRILWPMTTYIVQEVLSSKTCVLIKWR